MYVYAQGQTAGSWLPISCDGAVIAQLREGHVFVVNVPPGRRILSTGKGVPAFVEVRSGEDSFLRLDWDPLTQRDERSPALTHRDKAGA